MDQVCIRAAHLQRHYSIYSMCTTRRSVRGTADVTPLRPAQKPALVARIALVGRTGYYEPMRMIIGLLLIGALAAPSWLLPASAAESQISPPSHKAVSAVLPKRKSMPTRSVVSVEPQASERVLPRFPIVLGVAY
jgi:hypothetical protein